MSYYNIKIPLLDANTEYYLTNGYGGVATVRQNKRLLDSPAQLQET